MPQDQSRLRIATALAQFAAEGVRRVEWCATIDGTACPACDANDGRILTIEEVLRMLETDFCEHRRSPEGDCRCIVAPAAETRLIPAAANAEAPGTPASRPFSQRISRRPCPHCWHSVKSESPRCTSCHKRIAGIVALSCPECRRKWSAPEQADLTLCPGCGYQVDVTEAAMAAVDRAPARSETSRRRNLRKP